LQELSVPEALVAEIRPLTQPTQAPGQDNRGDVSGTFWLSHAL
jgi:hypothetical protein